MSRIARRILLLLLQGPRRPWWLIYAAAAAVVACWSAVKIPPPIAVGFGAYLAMTAFWACTRTAELRYYQHLLRNRAVGVCPNCGYSLEAVNGVRPDDYRCPECGVAPRQFYTAARHKEKSAD